MTTIIPRRNCIDKMVPAELAIRQAVEAVEACGADPRLTEAVNLLAVAQEQVADFVDACESAAEAGEPLPGHS